MFLIYTLKPFFTSPQLEQVVEKKDYRLKQVVLFYNITRLHDTHSHIRFARAGPAVFSSSAELSHPQPGPNQSNCLPRHGAKSVLLIKLCLYFLQNNPLKQTLYWSSIQRPVHQQRCVLHSKDDTLARSAPKPYCCWKEPV